ncbi:MAG: hypothetical protein AAGA60_09205 [Cyanobacteria bacterium P01_E01_bin.42]
MTVILQVPRGVPALPDLTQPSQLIELGQQGIDIFSLLILAVGVLGGAIALIAFALRGDAESYRRFVAEWGDRYTQLLRALPHLTLIVLLLVTSFFVGGTLSRRYHFWERAKVMVVAKSVAGDRMEQRSPRVRYRVQEPYTATFYVEGRPIEEERLRDVDRFLALSDSNIQVAIEQIPDSQKQGENVYLTDFLGIYQVQNTLEEEREFFFEMPPPSQYSLLENFRVEREGETLSPTAPESYRFGFRLAPGEETEFRVAYEAQGSPRWVYEAYGQLLSNFRLYIEANFPNANFASGIVPTDTQIDRNRARFTWQFEENVAVRDPFGVFTTTETVENLGMLPQLLLLAPVVLLGWLLLLYLSVSMSLADTAIAAGIFWAWVWGLTYLSRILPLIPAWLFLSLGFLALTWGLGRDRSSSLAAVISTLCGAVIPLFAFLVPQTGLTLGVAGILSAIWLAVLRWYRVYPSQYVDN